MSTELMKSLIGVIIMVMSTGEVIESSRCLKYWMEMITCDL